MTELEAYCMRDVENTAWLDLWFDVYHWVRQTA